METPNQGGRRELEAYMEELSTIKRQILSQEKLLSLGKLTGGIVHEIKNPLGFVNQFANISNNLVEDLQEVIKHYYTKLAKDDREEIEDILYNLVDSNNEIMDAAAKIDRIVQNLLAQQRDVVVTSTDLNTLIEDSIKLSYHSMRATHKQFNIGIHKNLDDSVGSLSLASNFSQALVNILENAFESTHQKKLKDSEFKPQLLVKTKTSRDCVSIQIRDNGLGIPQLLFDKIFTPFFTTKPNGIGLGLSVVRDIIVKQHSGDIRIDSSPGVYTEFIISLPKDV